MSELRGWPHERVDTLAPPEAAPPPPPPAAKPVVVGVADTGPEPDLPPEPASRPIGLVALAAVGIVAVLLSVFAAGDWVSRNQELDVLLTRIERAERSQLLPRDALTPLLNDCFLARAACDTGAIAAVATRSLPDLRATGQAVAATRLTTYHGQLRDLRDRYVEHNNAWQGWLARLAQGEPNLDPPNDIDTTFAAAGAAARNAVPPLPLHGARARVDRIFFHAPA